MRLRTRAHTPLLLALFGAAMLAGCLSTKPRLAVDEINYRPPQKRAAITLSDPQIYSRETLVNDRRREADYLRELLDKSKDAVFEPQIRRDLRTLTATVLQLQAGYDPLAGRQAARSEGLDEINNRIEETEALQKLAEARAKLIDAQRKLDKLTREEEQLSQAASPDTNDAGGGDGSAGGDGGGDGGGGGNNEGGGTETETQAADTQQRNLADQATVLRAQVDDIKKLIASLPSTAEVRRTAVGATPREVFRDRQAYRGELRGALAEVELDDAHDQGQNSLYRLQFHATVLPGRHQDKMGVARLTLKPPDLTQDDVLELYKTWLGHVTYRLNQVAVDGLEHDTSYLLLGMGLDRSLFHSTDIRVGKEAIFVALPPEIYAKWKEVTRRDLRALQCRIWKIRNDKPRDPLEDDEQCPEEDVGAKDRCDCELLLELSDIEPFMSASLRGLSDINSIRPEVAAEIHNLIEKIVDASDTLDRYLRGLGTCRTGLQLGSSTSEQWKVVPDVFKEALVRPCSDPKARCPETEVEKVIGTAHGGADVYATAPVELAQQVSTTLSEFRSFEVALALAASLPTRGLGTKASFDRLRATRTDLEGRERLPQVVGFAERALWTAWNGQVEQDPQFGWIFGPQAMIDAPGSRLRLRRPVVNLPVTADLSIPGWWPRIRVELETEWVANWNKGAVLKETAAKHPPTEFPIYLPLNRADLDGLTEYLAKKTVGGALPFATIAAVSPDRITTCADQVTFLVYGANLWRSSDAFLNGLKAKDIRVLPDMGGVAVTFDVHNGLPRVPGANGEATLTVWTRNGASSRKVTVLDPKAAGITCGPVKEPSLKLAAEPRTLIEVKDKTSAPAKLRVAQGKFSAYAKLGISVRPVAPLTGKVMAQWSPLPDETADLKSGRITGDVMWKGFHLNRGDLLQVSLVEIPVPDAEGERHAVDGPLVYYPTHDESVIQVKTAKVAKLDDPVELLLPYRYNQAYPDLKAGKTQFEVHAQKDLPKGYQISLTDPTPDTLPSAKESDDAKRTLTVKLTVQKDGNAVQVADLTTFLATNRTLTFKLVAKDGRGWALPKVEGTVTLGTAVPTKTAAPAKKE